MFLSTRKYEIAFTYSNVEEIAKFQITLSEILQKQDFELIYALLDDFDKVLDLKEGESMYFTPNRDNKESKAIILRTK